VTYLTALGTAYYRAGQVDHAMDALRQAMKANWGRPTPQILLILAMSEQRRGEHVMATRHYHEAQSWLTWYRGHSTTTAREAGELIECQKEVQELLGNDATNHSHSDSNQAKPTIDLDDKQLRANAKASNGRFHIQSDMRKRFGPSWSGGGQLLWVPNRAADRLQLTVAVERAGMYSIVGGFTKANDYGQFQLHVNGLKVGEPFEGFNPGPFPHEVIHSGPVVMGSARFEVGSSNIAFEIVGKHSDSVGYLVGIDYLRLLPITAAD
jgi:hypothetical protein